uniref:Uncharacterized protein n=1 Tax=Anguilla anguilla TaxID=7936 RepID=A0A0E9UI10_ANGAN
MQLSCGVLVWRGGQGLGLGTEGHEV